MTAKKTDHPFKNQQMPLSMRLFFSGTTYLFKILNILSPTLAGKLALRLFMTPPHFGIPRRERKLRDEATLTHLIHKERKISVRTWGNPDSPVVLLSHGWGGRCTQLHAFIHPLLDAGYRVIGFDAPAHGDSEGKQTNMLDVASIISAIEKEAGPFEAIIGHSFGTGTTLLSMDKFQVKANKVVLIAYFSDVSFIIQLFSDLFDLKPRTLQAMKQEALKSLSKTYGIAWQWDEISPLNTIKSINSALLLIHDKEDHEVPYSQAEPLQAVVPQAQKLLTSGYGHRKILMNKNVIHTVISFIHT